MTCEVQLSMEERKTPPDPRVVYWMSGLLRQGQKPEIPYMHFSRLKNPPFVEK